MTDALSAGETTTIPVELDVEAGLDALDTVDRQNKVGRTTIQAGVSASVVTVIEYALAFPGIDLDPWDVGAQAHFPPVFTGALFVLLAALAAAWMNRTPRT